MSQVIVLVSVDDNHREQILEVVEILQASGMKIERIMDLIGVIIGSIDSAQVEEIRQAEGVAAVEVRQEYQLKPPESEIQSYISENS